MHIGVYSLKKVLFEGDVKAVTCKTTTGEITVLDNHIPLISALAKGTLKIVDALSKEHFFEIASGFLAVSPQNRARLLVDEA